MDFKLCPACGASVLDDEAVECPSCGASMSGKPAAPKPAGTKGNAASTSGKSPATGGTKSPAAGGGGAKPPATGSRPTLQKSKAAGTGKPRPAGEMPPASDDPFDVASPALKTARPISPRPAKGRMIRVVCPMCETPGFISNADDGHEVKCCNPKCMMPVFKASVPAEPEPEPIPEPSSGAAKFWGISGVVLAIALFAAYQFVTGRTGTTPPNPGSLVNPGPDPTIGPEIPVVDPKENPNDPIVVPKMTVAQLQEKAFAALKSATDYQSSSRGKSIGYAAMAESLIAMNRVPEALVLLEQLGSGAEHFQLIPLTQLAWKQIQNGEKLEVEKTIKRISSHLDSLPEFGRAPLDVRAEVAALYCAQGQRDLAEALMPPETETDLSRLSLFWRSTLGSHDFDLSRLAHRSSLRTQPDPLRGLVAQILCQHAQWDAALEWSNAGRDVHVKAGCVAILAAERASQKGVDAATIETQLKQLGESLTPAGRSRAWTAVAQARLANGDRAGAAAATMTAASALAEVALPAVVAVPDMKALYDLRTAPGFGLPASAEFLLAANAAADLMECEQVLGNTQNATAAMQRGLGFLVGIAPNLSTAKVLNDQTDAARQQATRQRLATVAGLSGTEVTSRFSEYIQACEGWWGRAQMRQRLDESLLIRAAEAGLLTQAWDELLLREASTDPAIQQTFDIGAAVEVFATLASRTGNAALASTLNARVLKRADRGQYPNSTTAAALIVELKKLDWKQVQLLLDGFYQKPPKGHAWVDVRTLQAVQLKADVSGKEAMDLARSIKDPLLREESIRLVAARATSLGHGPALWEGVNLGLLEPADKVSFTRGILEGTVRQ